MILPLRRSSMGARNNLVRRVEGSDVELNLSEDFLLRHLRDSSETP